MGWPLKVARDALGATETIGLPQLQQINRPKFGAGERFHCPHLQMNVSIEAMRRPAYSRYLRARRRV
jgi:hypothetical protein